MVQVTAVIWHMQGLHQGVILESDLFAFVLCLIGRTHIFNIT